MSVPDPAAAQFYYTVFDMEILGETVSPLASSIYVSDDTISLAPLKYNANKLAGMDKHAKCIKHTDFWADNFEKQSEKLKKSGGTFFHELPLKKKSLYYEMRFRDPNGVIVDITHNGCVGAKK
jgi:hypothetical protein